MKLIEYLHKHYLEQDLKHFLLMVPHILWDLISKKFDNTNNTLTASILENGKVLNSTDTSDKYGIVGFWRSLSTYN